MGVRSTNEKTVVRVIAGAVIGLGVLGGAGFAVLAAAEGGAVPGVASGAGRAALPQLDGESHLGAAGCKGPICHTSADEQKNIYGDEWFLWHEEDNHSNAYRVLRSTESKRIARNLNSGKDPWQMRVCLDCHADNVPEELRGPKFQIANGVGCEACHGGSKRWLGTHDDGRTHAQNLADGMYPTDDPLARAVLCISCHYGNKDKFVTHRIMGAGHPRMSFELQNFTNIQPPHFAIDEDYRARGKMAEEGMKIWALGAAVTVLATLDALVDHDNGGDVAPPELVLFDCHACHHRMSEKRWKLRASTGLGPGTPRLNDSSFLMLRYSFAAVDPAGAKSFARELRELHRASAQSEPRMRKVVARMRQRIEALIPKLEAWKVDAAAVRGVLTRILADGRKGEFLDYAGAEQATLAILALAENLYTLNAVSESTIGKVADEKRKLLALMENPDKYDPAKVGGSFARLETLLE